MEGIYTCVRPCEEQFTERVGFGGRGFFTRWDGRTGNDGKYTGKVALLCQKAVRDKSRLPSDGTGKGREVTWHITEVTAQYKLRAMRSVIDMMPHRNGAPSEDFQPHTLLSIMPYGPEYTPTTSRTTPEMQGADGWNIV